ncbi:MAG: putative sulfate exporter family transporter [Pseudomonadales bacterium]|nr:putative sulfate exporter family transporter [Pseudomonadales bacterium]
MKMQWSEDTFAIVVGLAILALAALAYIILPYGAVSAELALAGQAATFDAAAWQPSAAANGLTAALEQLLVGLPRWHLNPFAAFSGASLAAFVMLSAILAVLFGVGLRLLKEPLAPFLKGFALVSVVALLAYLLAAQNEFKSMGLGYALWAIILGLLISNTVGIPEAWRSALKQELFIKAGLVLLGAEVLFGKILAIGLPGIFVAWIVTPIVLVSTYWFGQKILRIESKTLNITISADMSVCGVSAAIATAAACKAKKEELTTAIGLSMVFTSVMMVALPAFINAVGMPEVLGGAWIGGTIDATGAVVAAGAFLGDTALNVAATIKMIQNILIGVLAFAVAVYWSARVDKTAGQTVTAVEIWLRFPKFVLGFIAVSAFFSLLYERLDSNLSIVLIENGLLEFSSDMRSWLFCLAFVSIGLATNFKALSAQFSGGKPFILYICGQSLNLCLTLLMAWLMFYQVFPEITNAL